MNLYERFKKRPLSWSQLSSFKYNKEEWYRSYILGIKTPPNKEMLFGNFVGNKLAKDPTYLPQVPRLNVYEHPLRVMFNGIKMVGYMDNFCSITRKKIQEFKTGIPKWDQKRVDGHGQIDMYLFMHYISTKIPPEEIETKLIWLPTQENGDFTISLVEPVIPQIFDTKRTMSDLLNFGSYIKETVNEMQLYIDQYEKGLHV